MKFILNSTNAQLMSWGTKKIIVDGETTRFPVIVRKVCGEKMWEKYNDTSTVLGPSVKKMKRTAVKEIVSILTKGDEKQRACVDYKLHSLVYENATVLKRIIDDHVVVIETRKNFKKNWMVCSNSSSTVM